MRNNNIKTALLALALLMSANAFAEPKDIPPVTESEEKESDRAALTSRKNMLELELDIAKKQAELEKVRSKEKETKPEPVKSKPVEPEKPDAQITLVGVHGIDGHLTADLLINRMPLALHVGESFDDLKLKSLTSTCAKIVYKGKLKSYCLSAGSETVTDTAAPQAAKNPVSPYMVPFPGSMSPFQGSMPGSAGNSMPAPMANPMPEPANGMPAPPSYPMPQPPAGN